MKASVGLKRISRIDVAIRTVAREAVSGGCRRFEGDDFEAFVAEDVIERMLVIGKAEAPDEWMGLLLGHLGSDERGEYVVVRAMVHDHQALARPGFIESTHESEARTRVLGRLLFPDLVSLGWAHGHVKCGAFFSGEDRKTQATWTAPYSVGIVVDPWDSKQLAVFRGPESERLSAAGTEDTRSPANETGNKSSGDAALGASTPPRRSLLRRVLRVFVLAMFVVCTAASITTIAVIMYRIHLRVQAIERRPAPVLTECVP